VHYYEVGKKQVSFLFTFCCSVLSLLLYFCPLTLNIISDDQEFFLNVSDFGLRSNQNLLYIVHVIYCICIPLQVVVYL
jgi:hypothetical protein